MLNRFYLISILLSCLNVFSLAQTAQLSGGGLVKSNQGEVSYSIGQLLIDPIFGSSHSVWPGVQQPNQMTITSLSESDLPAFPLHIYPNPATEWIQIHSEEVNQFEVCIYDVLGHAVLSTSLNDDQPLNLGTLSTGLYLLEVSTPDQRIGVFQLIKK